MQQPKWLVIAKGRELGEFASRYAAMVFAERLPVWGGPYAIREMPRPNAPREASRRARPSLPSQSVKTALV